MNEENYDRIIGLLNHILRNQEIMSGNVSDLTAATVTLDAEVVTVVNELATLTAALAAAQASGDQAAIGAATTDINTRVAALQAAVTAATAPSAAPAA